MINESDIELIEKAVVFGFRDQDSCGAWERAKKFMSAELAGKRGMEYGTIVRGVAFSGIGYHSMVIGDDIIIGDVWWTPVLWNDVPIFLKRDDIEAAV